MDHDPLGEGGAVPDILNSWYRPLSVTERISPGTQSQQITLYGPGSPPQHRPDGAPALPRAVHVSPSTPPPPHEANNRR